VKVRKERRTGSGEGLLITLSGVWKSAFGRSLKREKRAGVGWDLRKVKINLKKESGELSGDIPDSVEKQPAGLEKKGEMGTVLGENEHL